MHNKFEKDMWKTFQLIAPTRSNYWRKMWKIAINRPFFFFFLPLLNLSENWSLVTCITNLKRICEKLFKLSRPQGQIIDVKCEKSHELVRELVISNMHNKFEKDTWKTFQVIAPTRSNYWRKRWKIAISRPFWIFFQPLLNLSEKWSLVTCKTNLGRKHEKLFKLSRPQVNVNADADADDAELQLQ